MYRLPVVRRLRWHLARFKAAEQGNIAMIFAITSVPILCFVGAAIDYSRATDARSAMQSALDSTVLMVARDLSQGLITTDQINAKSQTYFNALYAYNGVQSVSVTGTYTPVSGGATATIQVTGSGAIKSDFMQIAGYPTLGFNANSTTTWGASLLRVALVLDNTGSMQDYNKIGALQTAATNLVTQLSGLAQTNGDVLMSVIPFNIDVNVGTSNSGASWLGWDTWDSKYKNSSGTYCSSTSLGYPTMAQCIGHGYTWNHTPGTSKTSWNGCVSDRAKNYDVTADAPSSTSTYFPADQYTSCPVVSIIPLTYDWTSIKTAINSMTAQGSTNQTIGLQWGWLSLMQQAPLNAPAESSTSNTYQHIIILFTDGLNTMDTWYGNGSTGSGPGVDTRMKLLCDNIKAVIDPRTGKSMYTIYTVQIDTDGAGQSAVLPYCASGPGNFYMLTSPSQISEAFAEIGTSISKLRLAR
jgi:Flp pilus assembly protein TadG